MELMECNLHRLIHRRPAGQPKLLPLHTVRCAPAVGGAGGFTCALAAAVLLLARSHQDVTLCAK
jgi:hypothetical protein